MPNNFNNMAMDESQVLDLKVLDETDDELEEFDGIANMQGNIADDPELTGWCQDWDNSGWDDEDVDEQFVDRIMKELENYKASINKN